MKPDEVVMLVLASSDSDSAQRAIRTYGESEYQRGRGEALRARDLQYDPTGRLWMGYCDLCNGQHCVTLLNGDAKIERSPHRHIPEGES